MDELVFATNNLHKLSEIRSILQPGIRIRSLREAGIFEEIPEDFETLRENARQKARYIYDRLGHDCFADDTGLEVNALNGAPGVWSARYSRRGVSAYPELDVTAANIFKLLDELKGIKDRTARFRTVICLIIGGEEMYFEGTVNGVIIEKISGDMGFGYDPVFMPDGYSLTFAEMSLEEKNLISHRARAVARLTDYLKQHFNT